jgi:hypothetical protein
MFARDRHDLVTAVEHPRRGYSRRGAKAYNRGQNNTMINRATYASLHWLYWTTRRGELLAFHLFSDLAQNGANRNNSVPDDNAGARQGVMLRAEQAGSFAVRGIFGITELHP